MMTCSISHLHFVARRAEADPDAGPLQLLEVMDEAGPRRCNVDGVTGGAAGFVLVFAPVT